MKNIHHIGIVVTDLDRSIGFELLDRFEKPGVRFAMLELEGQRLEVIEPEEAKRGSIRDLNTTGINHIAFEVEDVQRAYKILNRRGVDIDKPEEGKSCTGFTYFRDPDGIQLELFQK